MAEAALDIDNLDDDSYVRLVLADAHGKGLIYLTPSAHFGSLRVWTR